MMNKLKNLEVKCTRCNAVWVTSPGCVCDCLDCGQRIVAPLEKTLEEVRAESRSQNIQLVSSKPKENQKELKKKYGPIEDSTANEVSDE